MSKIETVRAFEAVAPPAMDHVRGLIVAAVLIAVALALIAVPSTILIGDPATALSAAAQPPFP